MNVTHSPILYQVGGTALLARPQLPDRPAAVRHIGPHPGKHASNVPLEHGIEGELLKARGQASHQGIGRHTQGDIYPGESWASGISSAQRAISVYQYHAHAHLQPSQHLIDIYA